MEPPLQLLELAGHLSIAALSQWPQKIVQKQFALSGLLYNAYNGWPLLSLG